MSDPGTWPCHTCGSVGFTDGNDGFFYCLRCGSQSDDIIDTGVADEDLLRRDGDAGGPMYLASNVRRRQQSVIKAEPISQSQFLSSQSQFYNTLTLDDDFAYHSEIVKEEADNMLLDDGGGPIGPRDFGWGGSGAPTLEEYPKEVRMRYVMGLQLMVEFQCEVLVRDFKVTPMICGLAATIWLRFVAATRVFDDGWISEAIQESESQHQGDPPDFEPLPRFKAEPYNLYGQRAVMIWFRSLRKTIPLSCSLAICFLACHIAREAILPTDIVKWSLEGKLPYFSAFLEIEKSIGQNSSACPISSRFMFRPSRVISFQKLESLAASIAQTIGLNLPPVNFYAIASRYLNQLSLPVEKILPHACRVYEWSMPPNLWLSTNELRLPTRVCVMSILIVAIRIIFNIHGFGEWEKSLSSDSSSPLSTNKIRKSNSKCNINVMGDTVNCSDSPSHDAGGSCSNSARHTSHFQKSQLDASELLRNLEASYNKLPDAHEYFKDLSAYLDFCKDTVFAGVEPPFDDHEEEKIIDKFWEYYQKGKDSEPAEEIVLTNEAASNRKRSRNKNGYPNIKSSDDESSHSDYSDQSHSSQSSRDDKKSTANEKDSLEKFKDEAIRRMKLDMEENRFCYIPPRVNVKRLDYLHYVRKMDKGAYTYVAHADYYILLRACARAAQVDIRIMHIGVLSLEKRLAWLENRIDQSLHVTPPIVSCDFCSDVVPD